MATNPVGQTIGSAVSTAWGAVSERVLFAQGFAAGCGQAALLTIMHVTKGLPTSGDELKALINQGIQNHQAGAGGVSTPANLEWLAAQHGDPLVNVNYNQLDNIVDTGAPVILGVSNAKALGGNNARENVQGHYITVVGKSGNNYIVNDPNQDVAATGGFSVYTKNQLDMAQPFWSATTKSAADIFPDPRWIIQAGKGIVTATQGVGSAAKTVGDVTTAVGNFFNKLGALGDWLGNPGRIIRMVLGLGLITFAIIMSFLKEYGGDIAKIVSMSV